MATVNGKVIGIPALVDNLAVVYNKKLFAKAGLPVPGANWTWQQFDRRRAEADRPGGQAVRHRLRHPRHRGHRLALGGAALGGGRQPADRRTTRRRRSTPRPACSRSRRCGPWPSPTSRCTWTRPTTPTPTCSTRARSGCWSPGRGTWPLPQRGLRGAGHAVLPGRQRRPPDHLRARQLGRLQQRQQPGERGRAVPALADRPGPGQVLLAGDRRPADPAVGGRRVRLQPADGQACCPA